MRCLGAVDIRRHLFAEEPTLYGVQLVSSLRQMASVYAEMGRLPSAIRPAQEAVAIFWTITKDQPGLFEEILDSTTHQLSVYKAQLQR